MGGGILSGDGFGDGCGDGSVKVAAEGGGDLGEGLDYVGGPGEVEVWGRVEAVEEVVEGWFEFGGVGEFY